MNTDQVVVFRINDRTVSAPVQTTLGQQYVNGVPLNKIRQEAEWVNVFSKEKINGR